MPSGDNLAKTSLSIWSWGVTAPEISNMAGPVSGATGPATAARKTTARINDLLIMVSHLSIRKAMGKGSCASGQEFSDALHYVPSLLLTEFRIYGQRQSFLCRTLALGKRASRMTQIGKALLKVQRQGIVDFSSYALFL